MRNNHVRIVREAVKKVTSILSGTNIPVTMIGTQAYVESLGGVPQRVNIPHIPDNASDELLLAIQGFIDHEVAHILFTDFSVLLKARKAGVEGTYQIIEDSRIELRMRERFLGSADNLTNVGRHVLSTMTDPELEKALKADELDQSRIFGLLAFPLYRAWSGDEMFSDYMKGKECHVENEIALIGKDLISRFPHLKSSSEAFDLAIDVKRRLKDPDDPKSEDEDKGDGKNEEQNPGENEEQSSGDSDGSKSEENEEQSSGDSDDSGSEDESSGGDSDDDNNSDDNSESDEDQDQDDEGSEDDGPGDSSDDDDGPKSEDDPKGDGNDDDNDDGDSKGGDADAGDNDDNGGGDDSDLGDEGDQDEASSSEDGSNNDTDGDNDDSPDNGDESSGEIEVGNLHAADFDEIEKNLTDIDDMLTIIINEKVREDIKYDDYTVYTKEFDEIERPDFDGDDSAVEEMQERVDSMMGLIQKDLERAVLARSFSHWQHGQRRGRLNVRALSSFALSNEHKDLETDRIFSQKEVSETSDVAVLLFVDCSLSMRGEKIGMATDVGYGLASVLERLNIPVSVAGFTTKGFSYDTRIQMIRESSKTNISFSRQEAIYIPILKDYEERIDANVRGKFASYSRKGHLENNSDAESLLYAADLLHARPEERKIMIVLSDGHPVHQGDPYSLRKKTKEVVKGIMEDGIDIVAIGIKSRSVDEYYPNHVNIDELGELPGEVMGELRRILAV